MTGNLTRGARYALLSGVLRGRGLTVEALVERLKQQVGEVGTVLAVGSIVEGLGTETSDIDIMHLSGSDITRESAHYLVLGSEPPLRVDVGHAACSDVQALTRKIMKLTRKARLTPTVLMQFSDRDFKLLHRLKTGLVLRPDRSNDRMLRRVRELPLEECLATQAALYAYSWQLDIVGFDAAGDNESIACLLPTFVDCIVDIVLRIYGDTNVSGKFRIRRLRRIEATLRKPLLPPNIVAESMVSWYLKHAFGNYNDGAIKDRLLNVVRVANFIIPWSQDVFRRRDAGPLGRDANSLPW